MNLLKNSEFSQKGWMPNQDYHIETNLFVFRKETLCNTLSGFPVFLLTITAFNSREYPISSRKVIVLTARVHAAECCGSYTMEGILLLLTSKTIIAQKLRELYIFKIVPILNPEGVICGNFRCSLMGVDLNRRWDNPDPLVHASIYYLKQYIKKLTQENKIILLFCDFHGHTRMLNSFMFGCNKMANGSFCSWTQVRLLPRILAKKCPLFNYKDCRFRVESEKKRTARVVMWKELGVSNSFTLESSFYGYTRGDEILPYTVSDYYALGEDFCSSLNEYHYVLKDLEKEFIDTRGWLKPSRLVEITGTPAAYVLARQVQKEKLELKKRYKAKQLKQLIEYSKISTRKKPQYISQSFIEELNDECQRVKNYLPTIQKVVPKIKFSKNETNSASIPALPDSSSQFIHKDSNFRKSTIVKPKEVVETETTQAWRDYFSEEEMHEAFENIAIGNIQEESESEKSDASDSSDTQRSINEEPPLIPKPMISAHIKYAPKRCKSKTKKFIEEDENKLHKVNINCTLPSYNEKPKEKCKVQLNKIMKKSSKEACKYHTEIPSTKLPKHIRREPIFDPLSLYPGLVEQEQPHTVPKPLPVYRQQKKIKLKELEGLSKQADTDFIPSFWKKDGSVRRRLLFGCRVYSIIA